MTTNDFIYTTYINSTPEKVWAAITNPEFTRQYWVHENISDWKKGSEWKHMNRESGNVMVIGKVLESDPPKRLVLSWAEPSDRSDESQVTFEIEHIEDKAGNIVRLNVIHGNFKPGSSMRERISGGWPRVLSNLKTYLESGKPFNAFAGKGGCGSDKGKAA